MTDKKTLFSVYGDSLSTLQGVQPEGYAVHYQGQFARDAHVETMEDTWWGMVIRHFGGELLTCNAYSGCAVSCHRKEGVFFPSAASPERMDDLRSPGIPDVLLVCLGTNDWYRLVETEDCEEPWWRVFSGAYDHMMAGLRSRFPDTAVWCMNLTYSEKMKGYFYPADFRRMQEYNRVIASAARRYGAKTVDLWTEAAGYTSPDLAHPDRQGMEMIARAVIGAMERKP